MLNRNLNFSIMFTEGLKLDKNVGMRIQLYFNLFSEKFNWTFQTRLLLLVFSLKN